MACADTDTVDNDNFTEENYKEKYVSVNIPAPKGWEVELYVNQEQSHWPKFGNHILAQYDDDSIVVYQAYEPTIAQFAVENQRFGGPNFSLTRMSWIKTNFLWMMYRSGWASKKNQTRVLAVRISKSGFEQILSNAYTPKLEKSKHLTKNDTTVRLQWDPDHAPNYTKMSRRAIQLGLKGEMLQKYGSQWIVSITDVTAFARQQKKILDSEGVGHLLTARERIYPVPDPAISQRINLDFHEEPRVVGFS